MMAESHGACLRAMGKYTQPYPARLGKSQAPNSHLAFHDPQTFPPSLLNHGQVSVC